MTRGRWLAAAIVPVAAFALAPSPSGAAPQPTLSLATTTLIPGQQVTMTGSGWPMGTDIQVQLCGRMAIDGSADCALDAAATTTPQPGGHVFDQLVIEKPPVPCPCVVLVQTLSTGVTMTIPVTVVGAAVSPVRPTLAAPELTMAGRITGGLSWGSLFGAPAHRALVLTVSNVGTATERYPVLVASWGRRGHADNTITAPSVGALTPGARHQVRVPFQLDALSWGTYAVTATVTGVGPAATVSATTSTQPWGLYVLALVLAQGCLLWVRNRVRDRVGRPPAPTEPDIAEAARFPELVLVGAPDDGARAATGDWAGWVNGLTDGLPTSWGVAPGGSGEDATEPFDHEKLTSTPMGAVNEEHREECRAPQGGREVLEIGGGDGSDREGRAAQSPPNPAEPGFQPGSDVAHALDGLVSALRSETARLMSAQAAESERQRAELLDRARAEAAEITERASKVQEAARVAMEQASSRYQAVLRTLGQLVGTLSQIRDQATSEFEALQGRPSGAANGGPSEEPPSPRPWSD